ncbi:MAG TPA: hypothetical protein VNN18_01030 [Candidatus Xenobia bacterium]|nr:hypothetical protein [Candidatus Xenobia bacterium]
MREVLALIGFCALVTLGCLAAAGWAVVSGEGLTLDVLLLVSVCLTLAVVFGFCTLWLAHDAGLLEGLKRRRPAAANPGNKKKKERPPAEGRSE